MEHMESLVKGHFNEDPDRAMTRAEWEAIAEDSAKNASDARELLRLKKNEEDAIRARTIAAQPPTPQLKIMAQAAPESPIGDVFGALANRDENREAPPDVPAEVAKCIRELHHSQRDQNPQERFVHSGTEYQCHMSEDGQRGA